MSTPTRVPTRPASQSTAGQSNTTFGALLRQLRRRAGLTQGELAALVGFSISQISLLEKDSRLPSLAMVADCFIPALVLDEDPRLAQRLLELAAAARGVHGTGGRACSRAGVRALAPSACRRARVRARAGWSGSDI